MVLRSRIEPSSGRIEGMNARSASAGQAQGRRRAGTSWQAIAPIASGHLPRRPSSCSWPWRARHSPPSPAVLEPMAQPLATPRTMAREIAIAAMTAKRHLPDDTPADKPKRRPIPGHIPRIEVELTSGSAECGHCDGKLRRLGEV